MSGAACWSETMSAITCIIFSTQSFCFQLNGLHTELAKQLADTMVLPVIQFREKDLTGKVAGSVQLPSELLTVF